MSKAGQVNYKGINSQAFAALSLFLQNVNRGDFKKMILEGEKLEDFVLIYNSGKRIICESKFRSDGVGFAELKAILDTVIKNNKLKKTDELLIVSNKFRDRVKSLVNNFVFWQPNDLQKLKDSPPKFTDDHLALIPQIKLWEVSEDINREGILFLMYQTLGNKNAFWLDKGVLEDWTNTLLVNDIYIKSESGDEIEKDNFLENLENKKNKFLRDNGTDLVEVQKISLQKIESVVKLVEENNPSKRDVCVNAIAELIANPSLHYETLRRLAEAKSIELKLWDTLWIASVSGTYSFEIFRIFKNHLYSKENRDYAIEFINKILEEYLVNYHREEHIKDDIVEVCEEIFNNDPNYAEQIFEIVKKLFEYSSKVFYYHERQYRDSSWGREQVADFLKRLYQSENTGSVLKQQIIDYVFESFNLVEDDGKYWHFTPPAIFVIVSDYVNENPKKRLLEFVKIASEQYQKSLRRFSKKIKFEGWEHMGGGISQSGSIFSIEDRHFVTKIFQPALKLIPDNQEKWELINKYFITRKIEDVSFNKPDFLNRAVIPYLFDRYKNENSNEAFEILSDFIKMRKGIPWKVDLVYQYLKENNFPVNQQWAVIKVSLDEYSNLPVNVFVEQMVTEIAQNDSAGDYQDRAIQTLISWSKDPKYRKNRSMGSYDVIDSVFRLLNNPKTFNHGVSILEAHINSDDFKESEDTYGSWDVAKALALVISKDVDKGLEILKEIESDEKLGTNQQLILLGSLDDIDTEDRSILLKVYNEFIQPLLTKYSTNESLETRFFHSYAREGLVKYAELLAKVKYFEQSLEILNRLVDDSDPNLEEHDDNIDEHNLHQRVIAGEDMFVITSVRGNVAMVLRYFSLLPARDYFEKALPLLSKLCKDENFYIRVQATHPLMEFMKNRDTRIPDPKKEERFVSADVSKQVEDIAFEMLRNKENHKLPAVLKGLTHVFSYFRHMNQEQASEVMTVLLSTESETVVSDATSLLVFFAEFRKESYKKWPWGKLPEFDDQPFKNMILEQIKSGKENVRHSLSWEFWRLPKEGKKNSPDYNKKLFNISLGYFQEFVEQDYEKEIWGNIYRFIEDYLDVEFEACIELWKSCVLKERPYLTEAIKDKDMLHDLHWRPFFYNGKVLVAILKNLGPEEFIKWMEFLIDYPKELLIANDIDVAVSELSKLPKSIKGIESLFDKVVERYPKFFDIRADWLNRNK